MDVLKKEEKIVQPETHIKKEEIDRLAAQMRQEQN